jgi:hypothetical protein
MRTNGAVGLRSVYKKVKTRDVVGDARITVWRVLVRTNVQQVPRLQESFAELIDCR